jgi:hypothetical protein
MRHFAAAVEAEPTVWEAHKALGECFLQAQQAERGAQAPRKKPRG